jgi:hypothetical protein
MFAAWAIAAKSFWIGLLAFFIFGQAQVGWRAAQNLALDSESPVRADPAVSPPPIPEQRP